MNAPHSRIVRMEDEAAVRACYPLMAQLRPNLDGADAWVKRWRELADLGYKLCAIDAAGSILALAGYRVQENLVHGRFLYVDDLVTDVSARRAGCGAQLIDHLKAEACLLGCEKLVLDTALSNALGQRFYFRHGLLATALRFTWVAQTSRCAAKTPV